MVVRGIKSFLVLLALLYEVTSIDLIANYKLWKSVSNELTYDYSGNSRHGRLYLDCMFTDRGVAPSNYCYLSLMSYAYLYSTEYTFSFWLLSYAQESYYSFYFHHGSKNFAIFYRFHPSSITLEFLLNNSYSKTAPISILSGWNLHTVRVCLDQSIPRVNIELYLNLYLLHSDFLDTETVIEMRVIHPGGQGSASELDHILYEMWIHKGFINISELNYLLSSSGSCGCTYDCPTSPTTLCLPTYDKNCNFKGDSCPTSCTDNILSCDNTGSCIPKSKSECKYGLYDMDTRECLLFCPGGSCMGPDSELYAFYVSSSFNFHCIMGYNQISNDPPACISERCLKYHRVGYEYICEITEPGYILDASGDCCICDPSYIQLSASPLVCIKIPKCLAYSISETNYECISCEEGYLVDEYGFCNQCALNYQNAEKEPFTCIKKIDHCLRYNEIEIASGCMECEKGYKISSSGLCDVCQPEYISIYNDPLICKKEIEHCIEYDLESEESKCDLCEPGYAIGDNYECSSCDTAYINVSSDPFICIKKQANCKLYEIINEDWKCARCNPGFIYLSSDSECKTEIQFCIEHTMNDTGYVCSKCKTGFNFPCSPNCSFSGSCECDEGSYLTTTDECKECPIHCLECKEENDTVICIRCQSGFNLIGVECQLEVDNTLLNINKSNQIAKGIVIASISVSMASLNIHSVLSMIGTVEILSYILLYNIQIPKNIETILAGISIIKILPNIFEYFITDEDRLNIARYDRMEINNELFIINSGEMITLLIIVISAIGLLNIITRYTHRMNDSSSFKKYIDKLMKALRWNFVIGLLMQGSLELTISSLINICHASFDNSHSIAGFCISVIIFVILFISPILLFLYLIRHYEKFSKEGFNSKCSILYESYEKDRIEYIQFHILTIIRRIVYGANMVLFYSSPYIQVVINSSFSCAICYFMLTNKLYERRLDSIMNIYIEGIIFLTLSIIGAFIYEDLYRGLHNTAEWSIIILIYSSILLPALVNIMIGIRDLISSLMRRDQGNEQVQEITNISKITDQI